MRLFGVAHSNFKTLCLLAISGEKNTTVILIVYYFPINIIYHKMCQAILLFVSIL